MGFLLRKSILIVAGYLMQWKKDSRITLTAILIFVLMLRYFSGITLYGLKYSTEVTPWLLPVMFTDATISNGLLKVLLYLGVICLFCDAPFITERTRYQLIRSGRNAWWIGNCLYILIASLIYMMFLAVTVMIVVFPTITFSDFWGSTLREFVEYGERTWAYIGNLVLPDEIVKTVYPATAEILTFFAGWLSFVLLGLLICFLNLITGSRAMGIVAAVFLVMLDPVIRYLGYGMSYQWLYLWSPISWSSIESWTILGYGHPIDMHYAYGMYLAGIIVLTAGIAVSSRKKQIH